MRRRFLIVGLALTAIAAVLSPAARAKERAYGFCTPGQQTLSVSGLNVAPTALASFSECQVTVYIAGTTTLATIYSDNGSPPTPLANPFTAAANSYWAFYAANGRYSAQISGSNFPTFTYIDILLCDPAEGTGCGGSGSGSVVNFAAGNLPPLFTTTVTTPTTTPNLLFNLSNAPSFNFYGNFDATTGPPAFWQLIAGTNITLVPNTGTNTLTINSTGGGGGGCTPSGVDTGVLSEHPVGTCFDSLDFTWDDTQSGVGANPGQVMMAGDATNTKTGAADSFIFGFQTNKVNNCLWCWALGLSNNLTSIGLSNDAQKIAFGWGNVNSGSGGSIQLGDINSLSFAGASHCGPCNEDLIQLGFNNSMSSPVSATYIAPETGHQLGSQNVASISTAGNVVSDFVESGTANNLASTAAASSGGIEHAFLYGLQNRVKDDLGPSATFFEGEYGFDNEVDDTGSQSIAIYGSSNVVHDLTACFTGNCPPAQDSVVYGDQNTVTNAAGVLTASVHSSVTNCTACGVIGYNESNSVSDSLNIGLGAHEIIITNGHVTLPSLASAGTECVQASSTGLLSVTGSACGSGSGAVNSVTNSDGTLTIAPTTGAVVASLNLAHNNTWTGFNTFTQALTGNDAIDTQQPVPASNTNNQNSPCIGTIGNFWTGTASQGEDVSLCTTFGTGANPSVTETMTFNFRDLAPGSTGPLTFALLAADPASPVTFTTSGPINSSSGFQLGGTATLNHCLVGNGTSYVDNTCPGGGFANPMTTIGDMIGGGASGAATRIAGGLTGQMLVFQNGAPPIAVSPGLAWGNSGSPVTTTPYAPTCDSGTAVRDRDTTIIFQSGASVINVPDPTASGCTGNMVLSFYDDGAGTLTVNRGGTATFNILDGSTNTDGATSFTLGTGQTATLNANAGGTIWAVKVSKGASSVGTLFSWNAQAQTVTASSTLFGAISGSASANGTNSARAAPVAVACTASNAVAVTNTGQSATGSLVLTLFDFSTLTATGVTITIAAGASSGKTSGVGSALLTAGDAYEWQIVNNATATSAQITGVGFQCN